MKQIVLNEPGRFSSRDAAEPTPQAGFAVVRISNVGLCGSDYHAFAGTHPIYTYPRVIGHELSGVVADLRSEAGGIQEGDHCAIEPYVACGHCRACARNRPNCCENIQVLGIHVDGGLQEYLSVPINLLHRSDKLSLEQLALVETLGIGAHAVSRSNLQAGESALVVGAGPIGLAVMQFAKATGAEVCAIERNTSRQQFARRFIDEVMNEAGDRQADVVFDATGNAKAMEASLQLVAPGGRLVFVGLCSEVIGIDDPTFHKREVTLMASRNSAHQFPRIIQMMESAQIDTSPWIGARLTLDEVPEVFPTLRSRPDLVKAVVQVS